MVWRQQTLKAPSEPLFNRKGWIVLVQKACSCYHTSRQGSRTVLISENLEQPAAKQSSRKNSGLNMIQEKEYKVI